MALFTGCPPVTNPANLVYAVGDTGPAGGLVFYDKGDSSGGWRYLEAAPVSTEWTLVDWGADGTATGVTDMTIGAGEANTAALVTALDGLLESNKAAQLCAGLSAGGCDDWFLPSIQELNEIYYTLKVHAQGNFSTDYYWTSSEIDSANSRFVSFNNGGNYGGGKTALYSVRAVRAF